MAFVRLDGLPDIMVYGCEISQAQFEQCVSSAMEQNLALIKSTVADFALKKLVITGNSSKIPFYRSLMAQQLRSYKMMPANEEWLREGLLAMRTGSAHVLEVTAFEIRIEGDEKYSSVAVKKGETLPLRKKMEMRFPSGELTYSMRFFQNGLLVASCLIPERPSETRYNLYVEVDRNKMLNIYATNSRGLIKMNCNMMDLSKEEDLRYGTLLSQIDFHNEND